MGGFPYLYQIAAHILRNILQHTGQVTQSHNSIHRRTDLMAHSGEKFTFCLVFRLRLLQAGLHLCRAHTGTGGHKDKKYDQQKYTRDHSDKQDRIGIQQIHYGQ